MEDSKIIELFFARNEDAIQQTDSTYGRRLYHLADSIVRNDQDAEESVSDTYMKAWVTIPPHKPQYFFALLIFIRSVPGICCIFHLPVLPSLCWR